MAYLPYGGVRLGDASTLPTDYTFTGQRAEAGIGLMHYGARFYSPRLGRFISPDTIVPGAASGAGGGLGTIDYDPQTRLTPLTVGFHETQFIGVLGAENRELLQFGPPALWDRQTRQAHNVPMGPLSPQALNRYSYCLGNPIRYVDPSGRTPILLVMGVFAVVGAVGSGLGYIAAQTLLGEPIDRTGLGVAMLVGFVAGGVTPLIPSVGGLIALAAGANVAQYLLSNWLTGEEVTTEGVLTSAGTGGLVGWLMPGGSSGPIDDFLDEAGMASLRNLLGQTDIHEIFLNRAFRELWKEGLREWARSALGEAAVETLDELLIPEPQPTPIR